MASSFTGLLRNEDKRSGNRKWYSGLSIGDGELDGWCKYENDFTRDADYAPSDWVISGVGAGTRAISQAGDCGELVITNGTADDDRSNLQQSNDGGTAVQEPWRLDSSKKLWIDIRAKVSDADQIDMFIGLSITDTTPLDTTDRLGFQIDDGNASIRCLNEKNSNETSTDSGKDAADDTYNRYSLRYDGAGNITYFIDDEQVANHTLNIPDDENLALTLHLVNGEAVANSLTIDYILVAQER